MGITTPKGNIRSSLVSKRSRDGGLRFGEMDIFMAIERLYIIIVSSKSSIHYKKGSDAFKLQGSLVKPLILNYIAKCNQSSKLMDRDNRQPSFLLLYKKKAHRLDGRG